MGLVIILSGIDDNLIVSSKQAVAVTKQELMSCSDCKDCEELDEYVGYRLTRSNGEIKVTQDVLVHSFDDEFDLTRKNYVTPAKLGNILTPRVILIPQWMLLGLGYAR